MARRSKAEMEFWRGINKKCGVCEKKCKQSDKAEVLHCPGYRRGERRKIKRG